MASQRRGRGTLDHTHYPTPTRRHLPPRKKPRALNTLHIRWEAPLSRMEGLARRQLRTVTHFYQHASSCAHAMKHLRDLRSLFDSALAAKRAYYALLSSQLQDQINIAHRNHQLQQHNSAVTETHYATKHTVQALYTALCLSWLILQIPLCLCCRHGKHIGTPTTNGLRVAKPRVRPIRGRSTCTKLHQTSTHPPRFRQ